MRIEPGRAVYSLPSNFHHRSGPVMLGATRSETVALVPLGVPQLAQRADPQWQGQPSAIAIDGGRLHVFPIPDGSYELTFPEAQPDSA